jgi:hypothetical protein
MREFKLDDLLKKAALLSDKDKGIPHFCVDPEFRKNFWKNLSKHGTTKPMAQALNAIMSGRSFDEAIERFLRNITRKIPKEEMADLNGFVVEVKEILKEFYDLKSRNVTEFISAKNSFLSAIFIFTRYQDLREVINE